MGNSVSTTNKEEYSHSKVVQNIENLLRNGKLDKVSTMNLESTLPVSSTEFGKKTTKSAQSVQYGGDITSVDPLSSINEFVGGGVNVYNVPNRKRWGQYESQIVNQRGGHWKSINQEQPSNVNQFSADYSADISDMGTTELANTVFSDAVIAAQRDKLIASKRPMTGGNFSATSPMSTSNNILESHSDTSKMAYSTISDKELKELRDIMLKNEGQQGGCGCSDGNRTSEQPISYSKMTGGGDSPSESDKKKDKKHKKDKKNKLRLDDSDEFDDSSTSTDELHDSTSSSSESSDSIDSEYIGMGGNREKKEKKEKDSSDDSTTLNNSSSLSSGSPSESSSSSNLSTSSSTDLSSDSEKQKRRNKKLNRLKYNDFIVTTESSVASSPVVIDAKPFYSSDSGDIYGSDTGYMRNKKLRNRIK